MAQIKAKTLHRTPAIVISARDYGEADRIVTFFSNDYGKVRGIAKSARKSIVRFSNALEPLTHCNVVFSRKGRGTLALVEGCDVIDHYPSTRSDLDRTLLSIYLTDLTDGFTVEGKKNTAAFSLLLTFLSLIDGGICSDALTRFFEMRLLKTCGYDPALSRCMLCKEPVAEGAVYYFIMSAGGVRCERCCRQELNPIRISGSTINLLIAGKDMEPSAICTTVFPGEAARESEQVLTGFMRHILGREVKSLRVLNQVREPACPV